MSAFRKIFGLPGILLPVAALIPGIYLGNSALDIHLSNTSLIILGMQPFAIMPWLLLAAWAMHIVLAFKNASNIYFGWPHVLISIAALLIFLTTFQKTFIGMPRRYYRYENAVSGISLPSYTFAVFLGVQAAFYIFALTNIFHKRKGITIQI